MPVLITADDAGASLEVNEAIRVACTDGHVTSVAFLVNLPDFGDAVERVAPCVSHHSVHLNLVEGRPLALGPDSPLVDDAGWFRYQASQLLTAYYRSNSATRARWSRDIRAELAAQVTAFTVALPGPVAIDSHQHTHMFPFVLPQLLAAAADLDVKISRLRWPVERVELGDLFRAGGIKALALNAMAARGRPLLSHSPAMATTHDFCGVVHTGHMTAEVAQRFLDRVSGLPASELAELLLHPGGGTDLTEAWLRARPLRDFYTSPWRAHELALAMDSRLAIETR